MKVFVVLALFFVASQAEDAPGAKQKTYKRTLPADVLRDFPGTCFSSTTCATVEPGNSWDLTPFCGRSTCVLSEDKPSRLLEVVEDCGPLPGANPKCKLDTEKFNKSAPFPKCCPVFKCEEILKVTPVPASVTQAPSTTSIAQAEENKYKPSELTTGSVAVMSAQHHQRN